MKLMTERELMDKLIEAYKRGSEDACHIGKFLAPDKDQIESRLRDMIYADAGGHDGLGVSHG